MVKVRAVPNVESDGSINLDRWLATMAESNPDFDQARLRQACELIEQID